MSCRVVILARYPAAGQCKTRLIPALGSEGAADMHRRLAEHTVATVRSSGLEMELWGTGGTEREFTEWLGPLTYRSQPQGDLGYRLAAAAAPYPVVYLGTDCPAMTAGYLEEAARHLGEGRHVLGPAEDGGYWTMGLTGPVPSVFEDMPWGTDQVFDLTRDRLKEDERPLEILPRLFDVDRPEDIERAERFLRT
jgi:rSAM/selenodomain-associated transferase 1